MRARKIVARCPAAVRPAAVRHSGRSIEVAVAAASQPNMWLCGRCLKLTDARAAARCFLFVRVCVSSSVCCSSSCSFCALFCAHAKMFGITHARTVTKPRQRGIEIDGRRACVRECVRACVARRDAATCETPACVPASRKSRTLGKRRRRHHQRNSRFCLRAHYESAFTLNVWHLGSGGGVGGVSVWHQTTSVRYCSLSRGLRRRPECVCVCLGARAMRCAVMRPRERPRRAYQPDHLFVYK